MKVYEIDELIRQAIYDSPIDYETGEVMVDAGYLEYLEIEKKEKIQEYNRMIYKRR